ncbi:FAD-dependent oxidoreductase [Streptomyces mirabilis]|uniref:FAD-dependent oxidoreductase n=1 Tax=Streptomyces mirabilis TaxID=68239 RepID=UPI003677DBBF
MVATRGGHEGFVIDRGFQVFNTSYPQVRRRLALRALRLRPFTPGVLVHTDDGPLRLSDPTRGPRRLGDLRPGRLAGSRDLAALGVLSARDMLVPARAVKHGDDRTTRTALAAGGFSEEFVERFFRPFLSGVFLEDELETSSRVFHLVWRSMLRGTLCLPTEGIGAVPRLLADALPAGAVHLDTPVARLTDDGVLLGTGGELAARAVVVATGPGQAAALLPGLEMPEYRTVTTYYHTAPRSPLAEPVLVTDVRRRFLNTCVTNAWQPLTVRTVPDALPAMPPPQPLSRTTRVGPRRYVCGDHRATGSVQGALASGARAAREVARDLAAR